MKMKSSEGLIAAGSHSSLTQKRGPKEGDEGGGPNIDFDFSTMLGSCWVHVEGMLDDSRRKWLNISQ